jgi:hypothetical protein
MRPLLTVLCVFSVATLLSEGLGVAFLWYRGQLTSETLREIRLVLSGEDQGAFGDADNQERDQPSVDDVVRDRSLRILGLISRENELSILRSMVDAKAANLSKRQEDFDRKAHEFDKRLEQLNADINSKAAKRSRGILVALPTADAVGNLMTLELQQDIVLLKGMPDKSVAKILREFFRVDETKYPGAAKRGYEIFKGISDGEPLKNLLDETNEQLSAESPPARQ